MPYNLNFKADIIFLDIESATIAAMVGVPEKERIIEKYLSEKIQNAVMSLKTQIAEKVADRSFE